jgi:hypothetical protein
MCLAASDTLTAMKRRAVELANKVKILPVLIHHYYERLEPSKPLLISKLFNMFGGIEYG